MNRSNKKKRLWLINPRLDYKHYGAQEELSLLLGKRKMTMPLALPLIAALTPDHYDIRLIDDETDRIPTGNLPDLVGITTLVSTIDRAYKIADDFRRRGVPVVMGGSYATVCADEALQHADAVVLGEAENVWASLLEDFERGALKARYQAEGICEFKQSALPRWDLVNTSQINSLPLETSRGCPFSCEFCLVNKLFGRKMRYREISDVIAEIEALPIRRLFFVADNFAKNKEYAKELCRQMKPLDCSWVCQSSIEIAQDAELLQLMKESGCLSVLIGFESINPDSLKETGKRHNLRADYEEAIAAIHGAGVNVLASFIVGFDADELCAFDRILEFVERNNLIYTMLSVMAVAPGTDLHERMEKEGRLFDVDRRFINGAFPCIHYMKMSQTELLDGYFDALRRLFDWEGVKRRGLALLQNGAFTHSGKQPVSAREKLRVMATLTRRYAFSRNRHKRELFQRAIQMGREGITSMDQVVVFLLSMQAFHDYLTRADHFLPEVRKQVQANDRGAWESMQSTQAG